MRKITYTLIAIFFVLSGYSKQPVLRFKNQRFKIVQFTDLHLINGKDFVEKNDSTYQLMRTVIKEEKPDLVVITGDIVVSGGAAQIWNQVIQPMTEAQVPFAVTFGNHDTESDLPKSETLELLEKNEYNLTQDAVKGLSGTGNCSLPVVSSDGKSMPWVIYLFDSHAYTNDSTVGYYDWIKNDQIQWYRKQSTAYTRKAGKPAAAIAFFHIPLPEFKIVRNQKETIGSTIEGVCSPTLNSGLFTSFHEMGDVVGAFVGHDHNNDYVGSLSGICLGYGRKTGYASAYHEVLERGARVIELQKSGAKFTTHIRTLNSICLDYTSTGN